MIRIVLSAPDQAQLEQTRRTRPQLAERCHYVLLKAQGWSVPQIARHLDRNAHTIRTWLKAYRSAGLPGLYNTPQPGRPATTGQRISAQMARLLAHGPSHVGYIEDGWTVDLSRDYLAQHQGAASDATVRRQLQAGEWVYKRFANTVPRNAPNAEQKKPGWQKLSPPAGSATHNGREKSSLSMKHPLPMNPTSNAAGFARANTSKSLRQLSAKVPPCLARGICAPNASIGSGPRAARLRAFWSFCISSINGVPRLC
jgi:transposase